MNLRPIPLEQRVAAAKISLRVAYKARLEAYRRPLPAIDPDTQELLAAFPPFMQERIRRSQQEDLTGIADRYCRSLDEVWGSAVVRAKATWGHDAVLVAIQQLKHGQD